MVVVVQLWIQHFACLISYHGMVRSLVSWVSHFVRNDKGWFEMIAKGPGGVWEFMAANGNDDRVMTENNLAFIRI